MGRKSSPNSEAQDEESSRQLWQEQSSPVRSGPVVDEATQGPTASGVYGVQAAEQRQKHARQETKTQPMTVEQAEAYYGVDVPDRQILQRLRANERMYGPRVHNWVDEGMPTDVMGKTEDMAEFRDRQADRPAAVPQDIERQNEYSVQRSEKAASNTGPAGDVGVPDPVRDVISSSGQSLDSSIQGAVEERMGDNLGDVRIHTGAKAAQACEAIDARAFTVGNHIAFNAGEYDPSSPEGQHVLTHELAHVRQQTGGAVSMLPQVDSGLQIDPDPSLEREAEQTAQRVMQGDELGIQRLGSSEVHVQRLPQNQIFEALALFKEENKEGSVGDFQESQNERRINFLKNEVIEAIRKRNSMAESLASLENKNVIRDADIDAKNAQAYTNVPEDETIEDIDENRTKGELIERAERLKTGKAQIESRMQELTDDIADMTDQVALTEDQRQRIGGNIDGEVVAAEMGWEATKGLLGVLLGPVMILASMIEVPIRELWANRTDGSLKKRAAELEKEILGRADQGGSTKFGNE